MALKPIYQIHAELHGYEPKIWRRFLVQDDVTMAKLSYIIMAMFEMDVSHMFDFHIPVVKNLKVRTGKTKSKDKDVALQKFENLTGRRDVRLEIPNEFNEDFDDGKSIDSRDVKLAEIFAKKGEKAVFNYDYGDGWKIDIKIEKIITDKEFDAKELPCIVAGEGLGIIEDCGGIWGLADIAEAYKKGSGKEYDNYVEWLGDEKLDLTSFDIEDINCRIKELPDIYDDDF